LRHQDAVTIRRDDYTVDQRHGADADSCANRRSRSMIEAASRKALAALTGASVFFQRLLFRSIQAKKSFVDPMTLLHSESNFIRLHSHDLDHHMRYGRNSLGVQNIDFRHYKNG
jgi:hypothetical protein